MTAGFDLSADDVQAAISQIAGPDGRVQIDPETVQQDLAKLVLGLMAFLRELMEMQAIRRMEAGALTPEQEEALGTTLMRAEEALHQLAEQFGLTPADLSLDLGPLGKTI
ncbi:MAG: gas vesicle protein K [Pseudomonadota bacterium]